MSVRWVLRLPDSENDLEHSLQGRGGIVFFKWLLPENGFSPEKVSPRKWLLTRKWLLPEKMASPQKITSPQEMKNSWI